MKNFIVIPALLIVGSILVVAGNGDSSDKNVPKIFDYGHYVEQFRKAYSPIETVNKAKLFFGRTLKIFQHNVLFSNQKKPYYLGQNQFTDMTPEELKKYHAVIDNSDLTPVQESLANPDLPASSSSIVSKIKNNGEESESAASLNDLDQEPVVVPASDPVVNFMDESGVEDVKLVIARLQERPDLANQLAKVIENNDTSSKKEEEQRKMKEAQAKNKIEIKPVPQSNNKNYDQESIVSYGSSRDVYEEFAKNYAKFMMENSDDFSGLNLTPYEKPATPAGQANNNAQGSSPLDGLFGSMKQIYDYFTLDGYDESQDHDIAPTNVEQPKSPAQAQTGGVINYDIDWRQTGCIAKPKNQKDCNACYAFTTLALFEYFYCTQTKKLTEFSSQYLVDCGGLNELHGCAGGKLSNVGNFITQYGIELDAIYPYTAREGQCPIGSNNPKLSSGYMRPQITAWKSFPSIGAWYKWLPKSPIIVGISMPKDFFGYAGGIHDGSSCDENSIHAMLLVGSGSQDGKEFWLLRNSYSDEWGEAGYFRLSKAAPMKCFNSAVVVRSKFT